MRQKETPRVAVVGAGHWGQNLIRNFHALGALEGVCDSDPARVAEISERHGATFRTFASYQTLLSDPSVQAIVLATPVVTHERMAYDALIAGKDVFVEKPLATSPGGGEKLILLAEESERVLMVGHLLWYHPAIIELKRMVDEGDLGVIRYIYSNRLNFGRFRTEENILWSFAPHDISVILGLLDEMPDNVFAQGGAFLNPEIADTTVSTMSFPSGARAHIFVSWLHPFKEHRLVVIGDESMASFEDDRNGGRLHVYQHKVRYDRQNPVPSKGEPRAIQLPKTEPLRTECEHFLNCVRTRIQPKTDGREGVRVLKVLEQCQESLAPTLRNQDG